MLHDFCIFLCIPPLSSCDNMGALHLAVRPAIYTHAKHLIVDYHFIYKKDMEQFGCMLYYELIEGHISQPSSFYTSVG